MNKLWRFIQVPDGTVETYSCFNLENVPQPDITGSNQTILQLVFISLEPWLRIRMDPKNKFEPSLKPGDIMSSSCIVKVIESSGHKYKTGDCLIGVFKWMMYNCYEDDEIVARKIDDSIPLHYYTSILNVPGLTSYFGVNEICKPLQGQKVFISSAAGSVGLICAQLFKMNGCQVYGSTSSTEKINLLKEKYNFDGCCNYKNQNVDQFLKDNFPEGIDIYWDNVGGEMLDLCLNHMKTKGIIVSCGNVSQYETHLEKRYGVKNLIFMITKSLTMYGFHIFDYKSDFPKAYADLENLIKSKEIHVDDNNLDGFENAIDALKYMFEGKVIGKLNVRC